MENDDEDADEDEDMEPEEEISLVDIAKVPSQVHTKTAPSYMLENVSAPFISKEGKDSLGTPIQKAITDDDFEAFVQILDLYKSLPGKPVSVNVLGSLITNDRPAMLDEYIRRTGQGFTLTKREAAAPELAFLPAGRLELRGIAGRVTCAALVGGAGLAAVCDLVVAAEDAVFGFTEVRLGILPAVIGPFVVAKIGASAARALFLGGTRFPAPVAHRLGLVHEVVPATELDAAVAQADLCLVVGTSSTVRSFVKQLA